MSRIIALPTIKVKPPRRTPRKPGRFGAGLVASIPAYATDHTAADEAWLVSQHASAEDRHFDELEAEAIAQARIDMGLLL